ncbi:hypothetical protein G3I32_21010 [Streptomyces coelicoflavus]|uniref:Uncharacterized protein n=1 Tax=Streptomyces coelicoflavus TaxID=285562 RepID=A0A7K3PMV3_9ACTN|nr:hypothetical protein [Streptomyces coelicoflavus]NEB11286.1 hypothetical protein [Streptomyces coelicoflavus]
MEAELIAAAASTLCGTVLGAVLTCWMTTSARRRAERESEAVGLRIQEDALIIAVEEVRGTVATASILHNGWQEPAHSGLLVATAWVGMAVRVRATGCTVRLSLASGFGSAAFVLARERRTAKRFTTGPRAHAVPCHGRRASDDASGHEGFAESVDELLVAVPRIEDNERLDRASDYFGPEVSAVLGPQQSRLRRRRSAADTECNAPRW